MPVADFRKEILQNVYTKAAQRSQTLAARRIAQ